MRKVRYIDNLKIQNSKKSLKNFALFVIFVISFVKDSAKTIQVNFYALQKQDRPTFKALSNQGLCHLCSVSNTTQSFSEKKLQTKHNILVCGKNTKYSKSIYGKMLTIEISYNFQSKMFLIKEEKMFLNVDSVKRRCFYIASL